MTTPDLAQQRADLLARSGYLRTRLGAELDEWQQPLGLLDTAATGLRWLGGHPLWAIGAALVLTARGPRRIVLQGLKLLWRRGRP